MKTANVASRTTKMYEKLIKSLGNAVLSYSDKSRRPLLLTLVKPYAISVAVYLFLGTNPPGGRSYDEYKITLTAPEQQRREKGNFDGGDGLPLIMAYVKDYDVYIFFNNKFHANFGYNTNVQFKQQLIFDAIKNGVSSMKKQNGEYIVGARSSLIVDGFNQWIKILCD